ncbi:hypothetical protein FRC02_012351 [Tulasnella sp. 418]|nr:hypothetical protein FRC02_012351 [Tulasnella sp. 418]
MAVDSSSWQMAESTACPISVLPPELLFMIFEYVWDRQSPSLTGLLHCSLVCSKWGVIAQSLLFREVTARYSAHAQSFFSAINNNRTLGLSTRILDLGEASVLTYQMRPNHNRDQYTIQAMVANCPNLFQLSLGFPVSVDGEVLPTLLPFSTFNTLQALTLGVETTTLMSQATLDVGHILHFLSYFSSISHLHLSNIFPQGLYEQQITIPYPPPPSFTLYEFGWTSTYYGYYSALGPILFNYIAGWLFGKSSTSLRIFDLDESQTAAEIAIFRSFIPNHGRKLTSLRTKITEEAMLQMPCRLIEACPDLRELVLRKAPILSANLMRTLPTEHLQHFGYEDSSLVHRLADYKSITQETIEWFRTIPNLRYFTFITNDRSCESAQYAIKLWEEKYDGVAQLRVFSRTDPALKEDMVRTSDFPRRRTIANLSRMTASVSAVEQQL